MFRLEKIELWLLIFGIAVLSVYVCPFTLDRTLYSRDLIWSVLTIILFVSVACRAMSNADLSVDLSVIKKFIFPVFAGYLIVNILSLKGAVNIGEGLFEVSRIFVMLVFLFTASVILNDNKDAFIKAMALVAILFIVYGDYLNYTQITLKRFDGFGTMSNKNLWPSAAMLMLSFCVYSLKNYSKVWKLVSAIAIGLITHTVFLSKTRGALLAFFVFVLVLSAVRRRYFFAALLAVLVAVTIIYSIRGGDLIKFSTIKNRYYLGLKSLELVRDHPALGIGAGNWKIRIPEYSSDFTDPVGQRYFADIQYQRPHNDFIWVISESGIAGIVLYLMIFLMALFYLYKTPTFNNRIFAAGILAYMADAFCSFPKERPFHCIMLIILLAMAVSFHHFPAFKFKPLKPQVIHLISIVVLAGLSFAAINFFIRADTEHCLRKISVARRWGNWFGVLKEAESFSRLSTVDPMNCPLKYYCGEAHFMLGNIGYALESFKDAYKENPNNIIVLANLGSCLSRTGDDANSIVYFNKALKICPTFEGAAVNLNLVKNKVKND